MRFDSLDLVRYGHFAGEKIDFPARKPDYYLIYGDNEAGKSTLLRGISALLFDVPPNTPDVHSCKGPELRIGATISDGTKRLAFRRRKGTSGTLLDSLDTQIGDDALQPFLRELDRDRFEQFFGLNHDRLRAGGEELLRGKGEVGSALFQAAGPLKLRELLKKLHNDAKDLSPKSRTKEIGRILEEYRQAKAEVRKLAVSSGYVKEKQADLEAAEEKLARLKEESRSLQQELVRLRRIKDNKPDVARLKNLRDALAGLEHAPVLPVDTRREYEEARTALEHANAQISRLTQAIVQREERMAKLPANDLLKSHEREIEQLNAGTNGYVRDMADREKRCGERDDAIEAAQSAWKEIWPHAVMEAEKLKNVYAGKEEVLRLIREHDKLTVALNTAEEEKRTVSVRREQLEEELVQHPELPDPAALKAAIEQAKLLGDTDQLISRLRSDIERFTKNAGREMRKLARWSGTVQELEDLRAPLLSTIDQYSREWERLTTEHRNLAASLRNIQQSIQQKEGELATLVSKVTGAGENELTAARTRRDELWQLIRASAFEKTISMEEAARRSGFTMPLADAFAEQLHKADEIVDVRFANAEQVVIHDRLVKEIASAGFQQHNTEKEVANLEKLQQELKARWQDEWSALGTAPLSPAEMREWMQARQAVLEQVAQARGKEDELNILRERIRLAVVQIKMQWAAVGKSTALESESLPVLLRMAEALAQDLESKQAAHNDIQRQLQSVSIEKRQKAVEEYRERLSQWVEEWSPQVEALWLARNSTPDQVARALAVLEKVFDQLKEADRLQHRIKRMGDNLEAFEQKVTQVAAAVDPSCASLSADAAVERLHSQLVELGKAATERKTLQKENDDDKAALTVSQEQALEASAILERLKFLANSKDEQEFEAAIAASEQKLEKQQEYERTAAGLIERNTIPDLAQIKQEASAYSLDSLQLDINTKDERSKGLVEELSQAGSRHGQLRNEFERLETTEQSALQAQKIEDAVARLRPAVAQFLRLRLAAEVLEQAVESYRQKNQGPILSRASELFSRLTLGRHSGLATGFGNDDKQVLMAVRHDHEQVQVEGLSDGTLDQLYLALRLATIEHHVKTVAPCPVIFDDILINSDDSRSSAALQVIGDLAKLTQVLFFTHHHRLADLGMKAGAQMIELGMLRASAVA